MSLHTWPHQGPHKPSSCITFTLNSHWSRLATGKKISCVYEHRVTSVVSNSLRSYGLWPARLLVREGLLQRRILEQHAGQYWLPYPSRALHFLLP